MTGWETVTMPEVTSRPIRIGAVNYLNSKPLIEGLNNVADAELLLDYPSRLADDLESGKLDVALIPSIESFRKPGYEIVSDACVATHGPVLSVKLYSRVPIWKIRSLALDEGSRTSAALAQIMLSERFGVEPTLEPLPLGRSTATTSADAIVLIGDRAIHPPAEEFAVTWDMGDQWLEWTGLPFVFAMWTARADTDLGPVEEALATARDSGLRHIRAIARREAPGLEMSEDAAQRYLTKNLHYRLGSAERNGLKLFHQLAVQLGLAPEGIDLVFRNCAPAR